MECPKGGPFPVCMTIRRVVSPLMIAAVIGSLLFGFSSFGKPQFSKTDSALLTILFSSSSSPMVCDPVETPCDDLNKVIGQYSYIPNPCTTDPCLPGMAFAVLVDGTYYYLTVNGVVISEDRAWDSYTPVMGDRIEVTGRLNEEKDISGQPFYTIEVVSLHPVNPTDSP